MTREELVVKLKELYGSPQGAALENLLNELLLHQRDVNVIGLTEYETMKAVCMREGAITMLQALKAILEAPERYGS